MHEATTKWHMKLQKDWNIWFQDIDIEHDINKQLYFYSKVVVWNLHVFQYVCWNFKEYKQIIKIYKYLFKTSFHLVLSFPFVSFVVFASELCCVAWITWYSLSSWAFVGIWLTMYARFYFKYLFAYHFDIHVYHTHEISFKHLSFLYSTSKAVYFCFPCRATKILMKLYKMKLQGHKYDSWLRIDD